MTFEMGIEVGLEDGQGSGFMVQRGCSGICSGRMFCEKGMTLKAVCEVTQYDIETDKMGEIYIILIISVTIAPRGPRHKPGLHCSRASKEGTNVLYLMQWKRQCQKMDSKKGLRW